MTTTLVTIRVPDIGYQFKAKKGYDYSKTNVKNDNIQILKNIKNNDGPLLNKYGLLFGIPPVFIASFMAVESNGRAVLAMDKKSAGKMQISPDPFYETFEARLKSGDVAVAEQNLVKQAIPTMVFSNSGIKTSKAALYSTLMDAFIKHNEFGIYAGCLYLKFLIDRFAIKGKTEINKVIVGYNGGPNRDILKSNLGIALDSANLAKSSFVPKVSRGYLVKMLGIDGFLDLSINQKLVVF